MLADFFYSVWFISPTDVSPTIISQATRGVTYNYIGQSYVVMRDDCLPVAHCVVGETSVVRPQNGSKKIYIFFKFVKHTNRQSKLFLIFSCSFLSTNELKKIIK